MTSSLPVTKEKSPENAGLSLNGKRRLDTIKSATIISLPIVLVINLIVAPFCPRNKRELTKGEIVSGNCELTQRGTASWWLARAFFVNQPADLVLLGDSQINAAVFQVDAVTTNKTLDTTEDREAITLARILHNSTGQRLKVINLALGGAMISDQYLISKVLLSKHPPKLVILGISPRCFLDNSLAAASATEPFHFFEPYVNLGKLADYAFPDAIGKVNWWLKEHIPLLQLQDQICTYFKNVAERMTHSRSERDHNYTQSGLSQESGMLRAIYGSADCIQRGESIIKPIAISAFVDNTKEYQRRYKDIKAPIYTAQQRFFDACLTVLSQQGTQVIIVGMPCLKANYQLLSEQFWSDYRQQIVQQCHAHGALWVDLSQDPSFSKKYFLDNVHVNALGGNLLMLKIARLILQEMAKDKI